MNNTSLPDKFNPNVKEVRIKLPCGCMLLKKNKDRIFEIVCGKHSKK